MLLQDLIQQLREQVVELQLHDRLGVEGQEVLQDQIDALENRVNAILTYPVLRSRDECCCPFTCIFACF